MPPPATTQAHAAGGEAASASAIPCTCLICAPKYAPNPSADTLTRIRCHLFSWIFHPDTIADKPGPHIDFFTTIGSKCKEITYCTHKERVMAAFGLQNTPYVDQVIFRTSTGKAADADSVRYLINAVAKVAGEHGKTIIFKKCGVIKPLEVAFTAIHLDVGDVDDGTRLEGIRNWGTVIGYLRAAIEISYDSQGEQYSDAKLKEKLREKANRQFETMGPDPNTIILLAVLRSEEDWGQA